MFGIHDFTIFLVSCILLNLTPGPDTFYILGRSMAQGRSAGVASALGISAGSVIHTFAAACGLSALLATSASAFLIVKLAGAAYLVYLGARLLFRPRTSASTAAIPSGFTNSGFAAAWRQGLITNLLNPKVALFFLAFVPQFIAAGSPNKFAAFILLGLSFVTTGTLWCLCLAWMSALLSQRVRQSSTLTDILNRTVGTLFIALGIRLAAEK